jgi:peptidylprolyl isomerase
MTIDPNKTYIATLATQKGDIQVQLRPDIAPQHVNSFVYLAREGYFNGITFHRVIPGFVAQSGDPTGTGTGGPGYAIPAEFSDVRFERGTVGAARGSLPDSAGSQFFIAYGPQPTLNGHYTVFGQVTKGMDVVDKITPRDPSQNPDLPIGDAIVSVEIEEAQPDPD